MLLFQLRKYSCIYLLAGLFNGKVTCFMVLRSQGICENGALTTTETHQLNSKKCRDPLQYLESVPKPTELKGRFFFRSVWWAEDQAVEAHVKSPLDHFSQVSHLLARMSGTLLPHHSSLRVQSPSWPLLGCCSPVTSVLKQFSIYSSFPV